MLSWLEEHLVMIPMEPRRPGCSVVEGKDITRTKVEALAAAAARCWDAILARDLAAFAAAYRDSFNAQVAIFPAMVRPVMPGGDALDKVDSVDKKAGKDGVDTGNAMDSIPGKDGVDAGDSILAVIDKYSAMPGVLAWKMPGAGGGGYLACVVEDAAQFAAAHPESIRLAIRRSGM